MKLCFISSMYFRNCQVKFLLAISSEDQLIKWFQDHSEDRGFAMVGRSNVGKSSLINSLFGKKTARVSNTAGRTQSVNIFSFSLSPESSPYYLYDLPGYGHAQVSKEMKKNWNKLMGIFFENLCESIALINIQDARHPFQKADQEFHKWLSLFPELHCYLCFNKYDKLKTQKERSSLKKLTKSHLIERYPSFKISALNNLGLSPLFEQLVSFLEKGSY